MKIVDNKVHKTRKKGIKMVNVLCDANEVGNFEVEPNDTLRDATLVEIVAYGNYCTMGLAKVGIGVCLITHELE